MPPRKKSGDATASTSSEATRRSTRTSQKSTPTPNTLSGDELSSQKLALCGDNTAADNNQQEEVAREITVHTTRAKSYTSSRPSTANSDAASQSHQPRNVSSPVTKKDVDMIDVGAGGEDELTGERPASKKSKPSVKETPANTRKGRSKYDNPDEMLTNTRSPLATAKLRDLLCSSKAWDALNLEEKQSVLSKFPDLDEVLDAGTEHPRPNVAALRNNDNFRHDVARYQDHLRKGWHDPEWILQARDAHKKRELGAYSEYLAARFEEDWGMPMPGRYDSQEANWGSDDEAGVDVPKAKMSQQASEAQKEDGRDQDSDAMTGIEVTAQENDGGGRPGKEEPEKSDGHVDDQAQPQPLDVSMAEDERAS
ncbi:Asx homology domain-containing protein [Hypoxylon sp. FL0543]|nr:Asx homology domain-containing protein [Hypoxylon sp. FL0543]